MVIFSNKVGCVFPMVIVSILPHAGFRLNDHRKDAPHFIICRVFTQKKNYGNNIFIKYKKTHSMDLEDSVQLQNLDDLLDDINDLN